MVGRTTGSRFALKNPDSRPSTYEYGCPVLAFLWLGRPIRRVTVESVEVVAHERREFGCIALEGFNRGLQQIRLFHVFPSNVIASRVS